MRTLLKKVPGLGQPGLTFQCPWWKFATHLFLVLIFLTVKGYLLPKSRTGIRETGVNKSEVSEISLKKKTAMYKIESFFEFSI